MRTTSGGIVTITSLLVIFWLVWGEWAEYRQVVIRPELVVDKGRGGFFFLLKVKGWSGVMERAGWMQWVGIERGECGRFEPFWVSLG